MGNAGSHGLGGGAAGGRAPQPRQPLHWQHSLPSDPLLKASHLKVLPDLDINPRLRSTNNGAILHSGGTISGRRPLSLALPHDRDPAHNGVYRSKSITAQDPYDADRQPRFSYLSNQRDPLHRSQTHLHLEEIEDSFAMQSKRFGSEPDLRNSQEPQPKAKVINKNVKKKYKAPPPPHLLNNQGGSSPDSWRDQPPYQQHQAPQVPSRKLRLFKTRAETKKNPKHNHDIKSNGFIHHKEFPPFENNDRHFSNDAFEQSRFIEREKMLRSPSKERDEYIKYPSSREDDMVQTQSSLRREENILQTAFSRQEFLRTKHSQQNMYREKSKREESKFDSNKAFRNSERFKKQNMDPQMLRREKSFDNSLMHELNHAHDANRLKNDRSNHFGASRDETDKLESRFEHREVEKSVESNKKTNGIQNSLASAEFQAELLMATRKLRVVNKTPEPSGTKTETSSSNKVEATNRKPSNDKKVLDKEGRSSRTPDAKPAAAKNSSNQSKSNLVTLDRSKLVKSKERAPRIVKEEKKEDAVKTNGVKVLPSNDKVGRENNRNRRESRVLADRGQASGKESTPEVSPSRVKQDTSWDRNQQNQPSKSFYFGMGDNTIQPVEEELNVHEKVRRHLEMNYKDFPKMTNYPVEDMVKKAPINGYNTRLELPQGSSESALSSEPEIDDPMSAENNPHGIALQLRPTLPKKQLEIPRFSPAAAWRLLAALEAETEAEAATNLVTSVEKVALVDKEDRIERHQRPRPARSTHDKSGDSGISGDAGPANEDCPDTPTLPPSPVRREEPSSQWTPQQDLEEESSSDAGGPGSPHGAAVDSAPAKFSARQQVFSLSLPRETHIAHLADKSKQSQQAFNSLQKFRKSVSGALGNALGASKRPEDLEENSADEQADNNWFLSRSAPNSLNNGLGSPNAKMSVAKSHDSGQHQTPPSSDQEDERLPPVSLGMMRQQPPFSYLATGGHVMYLPQYDSQRSSGQAVDRLAGPRDQPYSMGYQEGMRQKTGSDGEMEELDPASKDKYKAVRDGRQMMMSRSKSSGELILNSRNVAASKPRVKGKRFTFQSTVRQIERKRLADKLSREAETKERQRLSELEAMRRVEEEFQRKRAREKASIRQQLRLVSLDESCSSLPSSWGGQGRIEPEGAVSPSPPPASGASGGSSSDGLARAPATRVLSEYRQATREYRDYRRGPQPPTVHPPACYNMPRAPASRTAVVVGVGVGGAAWAAEAANDSDNYRREFARGRRAPSSSGSDLSQGARLVTPPRW